MRRSDILRVMLILIHRSVYSAYEHAQLPRDTTTTSSQDSPTRHELPLDITIETLVSVAILCLGLVTSSAELRPIQWKTWAGKIEKEPAQEPTSLDNGMPGNPFAALEERVGFLDIRAQRKAFSEWETTQKA